MGTGNSTGAAASSISGHTQSNYAQSEQLETQASTVNVADNVDIFLRSTTSTQSSSMLSAARTHLAQLEKAHHLLVHNEKAKIEAEVTQMTTLCQKTLKHHWCFVNNATNSMEMSTAAELQVTNLAKKHKLCKDNQRNEHAKLLNHARKKAHTVRIQQAEEAYELATSLERYVAQECDKMSQQHVLQMMPVEALAATARANRANFVSLAAREEGLCTSATALFTPTPQDHTMPAVEEVTFPQASQSCGGEGGVQGGGQGAGGGQGTGEAGGEGGYAGSGIVRGGEGEAGGEDGYAGSGSGGEAMGEGGYADGIWGGGGGGTGQLSYYNILSQQNLGEIQGARNSCDDGQEYSDCNYEKSWRVAGAMLLCGPTPTVPPVSSHSQVSALGNYFGKHVRERVNRACFTTFIGSYLKCTQWSGVDPYSHAWPLRTQRFQPSTSSSSQYIYACTEV